MTSGTFYLLLITVVLAVAMSLAFSRARIGMNATALREDPVAASAIGISPHRTGVLLGAAGGMAAVAGFLLTPIVTLSASALTLLVIPGMASALLGRLSAIGSTVVIGSPLGVVESVPSGQLRVNNGIVESLRFGSP